MKQTFMIITAMVTVFLVAGCTPRVYEAPQANYLTSQHEVVAIVPPSVTISGRKKDDPQMLKEAAETERFVFQREMYSWMLRRKQQGRMTVRVLDVETTNARLTNAGFFDGEVKTPAEWANLLEVDAVFMSQFKLSKPMSEGASAALGILFGAWGTTNRTDVNIDLHDAANQELIWNYDWQASGSNFTSPEDLINGLMRNASKRMPYTSAY